MKTKDNKIVEATEVELYKLYLDAEWDLIMSFEDYLDTMKRHGVKVVEDEQR